MTNKLVVITNSLKVPKIKNILLYEMKFLVPNYSCLQNPWLGGYRPQISVLSVLCTQLKFLNPPPPPPQNSLVRHRSPSQILYSKRGELSCGVTRKCFFNKSLAVRPRLSVELTQISTSLTCKIYLGIWLCIYAVLAAVWTIFVSHVICDVTILK